MSEPLAGIPDAKEPKSGQAAVPLFDAYAPAEVAQRVRDVGVAKAAAPLTTTFMLALLAGAFIALGALFFTITITTGASAAPAPYGLVQLAGGMTFSLGLVLVIVGGAELFTGNNLIAMAWASKRVTTRELAHNWVLVYLGNLIGAVGTAVLVWLADVHLLADGAVGETMVRIAKTKVSFDPLTAVARGILCNALVCLAVWLCMAARSVADKILAIILPISAFVACGFEHSIANLYFLPCGMLLAAQSASPIGWTGALANLVWVTVGNILGGTVLVAFVYWSIYLRKDRADGTTKTLA
jgi:formate/nitrite transporter